MSSPPLVSYAQNFEDIMLWRVFRNVLAVDEPGFYVDVGANAPRLHSVSKLFYDRGWNGINVEPVQNWFDQLEAERPRDINLAVCATAGDDEVEFLNVVDTGLSTNDFSMREDYEEMFEVERATLPGRTLANILDEHAPGDIHFMKVDVEGMEYDALAGCNFAQHRPWIVVVESIKPLTYEPAHQKWEELLTGNGYEYVYFDGLNRFYVAEERSESVTHHFESPPNVFDSFLRDSEFEANERLLEAEAKMNDAYRGLDAKQEEVNEVHATFHDLHGQIASLQSDLTDAEKRLAGIQRTRSWRITKPLRIGFQMVRQALSSE